MSIMSPSSPFIMRPVATILLTFGIAAAGAVAFFQLPVAPLPQVDFPTISVRAQLPGASPEVVATTVATPLERHLSQIADVTEMTSQSTVGSARINLQFGLDRDIDGAARDVQAAINAARVDLPTSLRSNPTYKKVNPADSPILILTLTSDTLRQGELYDAATTVISQKLSQVEGIGEVVVGGSSLPAVRVELNPSALFKYGLGLEDVRAALASANAHSPKGDIETDDRHFQIYDNDQASVAADYRTLLVAYRNGAAIRLSDVAEVNDANENLRNAGLANGKPSVLVTLYRQPGANIIATVDRAMALLPELRASISPAIDVLPAVDRSTTIRASLKEVERTLGISVILVVVVVFLFLRSTRATIVPSVAVPVSLVGTFGVMYLLGYSIDNLSLMALTVATGFVVDDAIVVLENISRHIEAGMPRVEAAIKGAAEVGFTVMSMSISLCAVFIPILLMGGIVGRLFREFAVTLSVAILVSLAVSLTTTPMLCALLLKRTDHRERGRFHRVSEGVFDAMLRGYERSLRWALDNSLIVLMILLATIGINVYLYIIVPKGFFPQQDTGRMNGFIQADQSASFQLMRQKMAQFIDILLKDPAVDTAVGFTGGGQTNGAFVFMSLKPLAERKVSADQVIRRLRPKLAQIPGATLFLQAVQDIRVGGRNANAQYQFTLQADTVEELYAWAPKILAELQRSPKLADVNSDQQDKGLETQVTIDRDTAARLGHHCRADRQYTLRRLRPAAGIDDLQCPPAISRHHGGGAAILAKSADAQSDLRQQGGRHGWRHPVHQCGRRHRHRAKERNLAFCIRIGLRGRLRCGPQSCPQLHRQYRQGSRFHRVGGQHQLGGHGAAERSRPFCAGEHPARRQSSGTVCRHHDVVQPSDRRLAERGGRGGRRGDEPARRSRHDSRHVPGDGARL